MTDERKQLIKNQGGWLGYKITDKTNVHDFIEYFKIDLEDNILKILDKLKTIKDCVAFYAQFDLWGDSFMKIIKESGLDINENNASL